MKRIFLLLFLFLFIIDKQVLSQSSINVSDDDHPVRVACIGASTTYGANIPNIPLNSFPAQLGRMLGPGWEVRNFGVNSTGILKKGDFPYWNTNAFKAAQQFLPDVVIFNIGVNDVKPQNWKYKSDFFSDYKEMIRIFRDLPSHPRLYLCKEIPVYQDHWGIRASVVNKELDPMMQKLAREEKLPIIDLHAALQGHPELFTDGIHPDAQGAGLMAVTIAHALTGKALAPVYAEYPGVRSEWHGFDRYDFQFGLLMARMVIPHKPAPGNPWVWRARFPDWHDEMDSILLSKGFFVVYLNTDNMYGSPRAIGYWNEFYQYLSRYYHLREKVALEGVSRGALFIYRFAKTYPQRVACIYAEAPVCDILSWPGGKEKSPGDTSAWRILLHEYHLTDQQAMHYKGNPIDSLEKLAKYKVPIWHSIGLHDSLAPPAENTFILVKRYIALGGPATIYPNTLGKTSLHGHHFPIDDPGAGANFIIYNCTKSNNDTP